MEVGLVEWFAFEDRERVNRATEDLKALKAKHLRTLFSWADWQRPGGREWFDWYIPRLAESGVEILPSLFYTPIDKAMPDSSGLRQVCNPPINIFDYVDFVREMIERYGQYFEWLQLWNEPNWKVYWNDKLDPHFDIYSAMIREAGLLSHALGKKNALGGMMPYEPQFLTRLAENGALQFMDAICLHHAESWPPRERWYGWQTTIANARAVLKGHGSSAEVWIAETGASTYAKDPKELEGQYKEQIYFFDKLKDIPADRIYWIFLYDQRPDHLTDDAINLGVEPDLVAYHFGLKTADGEPKPIFWHWQRWAET